MSSIGAADKKKKSVEEGLQDVDLSSSDEEDKITTCADRSSSDEDFDASANNGTMTTNTNTYNKSQDQEPQERYPWWKGGGMIPHSGRDLGVFDESLEDRANCFGLWWMTYLNPLLDLGSRKVLDADDVGVPSCQDRADRAYMATKQAWDDQVELCRIHNESLLQKHHKQQQRRRSQNSGPMAPSEGNNNATATDEDNSSPLELKEPSVAVSLVNSFGSWKIVMAILFQIISALLSFVPVLILDDLVRYFEWHTVKEISPDPDSVPPFQGMAPPWLEVVGLGLIPFFVSLLQTRHNAIMAHCGVFVRTAVSTLLYRKALTVSAAGRAKTSTGQVVNMMSNDTMQLQRFLQFIGMTMIAPLQIVIALVLIYQQVGNAMWVGVAYMVFLMPINMWVFSVVGKMRRKVLKHSDSRVKMMNEILTGIRIIKFYAWERPFGKEVSTIRGKEMDALTKCPTPWRWDLVSSC